MAYNTEELKKQAIERMTFEDSVKTFTKGFKSEDELVSHFSENLSGAIYSSYGKEVSDVKFEQSYDFTDLGLSHFITDIEIECIDGNKFIVEAKNPHKNHKDNLYAISQLMNYKMSFDYIGNKYKYILLTSIFDPYIIKFILDYNLPIDVAVMSREHLAIWRHDE